LIIGNPANFDWSKGKEFMGMLVQNPDNFGNVKDFSDLSLKLKENKMIFTIVSDILSLNIFKSPKQMGADIACGSA